MSDSDDPGRGVEILPLGLGRELQKARMEDSHPIPEFDLPDGWYNNGSMEDKLRTETSIRSEDWEWHIDVRSVTPLSSIEGPYWMELRSHIGGPSSFETRAVRRLTAIEPGAVWFALEDLIALAELQDAWIDLVKDRNPPWFNATWRPTARDVGRYTLQHGYGGEMVLIKWVPHDQKHPGPVHMVRFNGESSPIWNEKTMEWPEDLDRNEILDRRGVQPGDMETVLMEWSKDKVGLSMEAMRDQEPDPAAHWTDRYPAILDMAHGDTIAVTYRSDRSGNNRTETGTLIERDGPKLTIEQRDREDNRVLTVYARADGNGGVHSSGQDKIRGTFLGRLKDLSIEDGDRDE